MCENRGCKTESEMYYTLSGFGFLSDAPFPFGLWLCKECFNKHLTKLEKNYKIDLSQYKEE